MEMIITTVILTVFKKFSYGFVNDYANETAAPLDTQCWKFKNKGLHKSKPLAADK